MGLREAKKEKTRKLISDVARDLFIENGFEAVTVAEIAKKAEVAVATLFNYFPTKESLIFDLEDEIDSDIVQAIRGRSASESIMDALHSYFISSRLFNPPSKKTFAGFAKLIRSSPALSSYLRGLWGRYEKTLADEIQNETSSTRLEAECVAKLLMEGVSYACNSSSPKETLNLAFGCLKNGWNK